MSLPFRPRIDWSTFSETLTWPMYPWEVEDATVGGHAVASSGEEEAYVVRHDQLYRLRLRFDEIEWRLIVQPWLRWARERAQSFTLWLDQSDAETQVECLLVAPVAPAASSSPAAMRATATSATATAGWKSAWRASACRSCAGGCRASACC